MLTNGNYSRNPSSLQIPIYFGKDRKVRNYGCLLLEDALNREGIMYYIKPNENGSITLVCRGPYRAEEIVRIVKQAILQDINPENKEKSPLRSSLEKNYFFLSEND